MIFDRSDETVVLSGSPSDLGMQAFVEVAGALLARLIEPMTPEEQAECLNAFLAATAGAIAATVGPRTAIEMLQIITESVGDIRSQAKGEH
jgi:hypothetical protein